VLLAFTPATARADGGHIALHATSGAYTVTLFTAPDPLVTGPADISLLVQDAASEAVASDAIAAATLTGPAGPIHLTLTHAAASNKLLLAGSPVLISSGAYHLQFAVARPGAQPASFTVDLPVAANHTRRTTLVFAMALPLLVVFLFLVNQHAKHQAVLRRALPR
jgi:hypothetical protein